MYRLPPLRFLLATLLVAAVLAACGDDDPASEPLPDDPEPRISVDVSRLDFGEVDVGESAEETAEVRNIGDGTLSGEVTLSGSAAYELTAGSGRFSLGEGATREVTIRFAPEDEGEAEAELQIAHEADNEASPLTVPTIGEGRAALADPPDRP